jgi:hypothetical protein
MFSKLMLKTDSDSLGRDESNDNKFLTQPNSINPLPALTYQNVLDLNVACQSKRTQMYWLYW